MVLDMTLEFWEQWLFYGYLAFTVHSISQHIVLCTAFSAPTFSNQDFRSLGSQKQIKVHTREVHYIVHKTAKNIW